MKWYFAVGGEQRGPVDQAALEKLLADGVVSGETLVWREGLAEWTPLAKTRDELGPAPVLSASSPSACSRCGKSFPPDELIQLLGQPVCGTCKPFLLQTVREGAPIHPDSERIRQEHLKHEAAIKSVGTLYLLGSVILIPVALMLGVMETPDPNTGRALALVIAGAFLGLAIVQLWAGLGLRRLKPSARIAAGIISGIGLLGFPLGTLINGYILYLIFSKKGKTVFSEPYQRVIADTPHIRYRTSIIVWILLGLLLLFLGTMLGLVMLR